MKHPVDRRLLAEGSHHQALKALLAPSTPSPQRGIPSNIYRRIWNWLKGLDWG